MLSHHDVKIKFSIHPIYIINGNTGRDYKKKLQKSSEGAIFIDDGSTDYESRLKILWKRQGDL